MPAPVPQDESPHYDDEIRKRHEMTGYDYTAVLAEIDYRVERFQAEARQSRQARLVRGGRGRHRALRAGWRRPRH